MWLHELGSFHCQFLTPIRLTGLPSTHTPFFTKSIIQTMSETVSNSIEPFLETIRFNDATSTIPKFLSCSQLTRKEEQTQWTQVNCYRPSLERSKCTRSWRFNTKFGWPCKWPSQDNSFWLKSLAWNQGFNQRSRHFLYARMKKVCIPYLPICDLKILENKVETNRARLIEAKNELDVLRTSVSGREQARMRIRYDWAP